MATPQLLKLPQRLIRDFDRKVIKIFRELEEDHRAIARFRNHLHFTLHCKHHDVCPTSLKIKTSVRGRAASNIINRAQRALMNERIKQINTKLSIINSKIEENSFELGILVPDEVQVEVTAWCERTVRLKWDKVRMRHQRKFAKLQAKQKADEHVPIVPVDDECATELKERWVVNLSDHSLTDAELSVLRKGLNFAVSPDKLPVSDYITSIESACRLIGPYTEEAAHLRSECVNILKQSKPPKSNLSREQRRALQDLRKNDSIMILPADKGRATVIMPKGQYFDKAHKLLEDGSTYQHLTKDPTSRFTTKLTKQLQGLRKDGELSLDQYRKLYPSAADIPKFYGLPKVHKADVPLRPIVASRGSLMYETARFIADILTPLVGKTEHFIANSADLVEKLSAFVPQPDELLVSYDVTALFTSIPVQESVDIIRRRLENDNTLQQRTTLSVDHICELLDCCLTTTYFTFEGQFYQQKEGAAMGSPVSPIVANLFMEDFEERALALFHTPPRYWGRYMDDTMTVLNESVVEDFSAHLNKLHPAIQFTREVEENGSIAMLDTRITRTDTGLEFSVYRKPTHTDQYLQFDSHQPLQHKLGVIRTLTHRANTICSTDNSKKEELDHIKKVLSVSGYRKWTWDIPGAKKIVTHPAAERQTPSKGHVSIPYVSGVSEALSRKIRKLGVCVHSKPTNTIRSQLVAPKDKTNKMDKSGVIYKIECRECEETYIGETERNLHRRIKEHKRESSPVGEHLADRGHHFDQDNVNVLDREPRWFQRGVKEAIHIAAGNPTLNRDRGRHNLPAVYHSLVQSHCREFAHGGVH